MVSHTHDHSSDDTSSSLGDSEYEILGDSSMLTSEDEDHDDNTDSVASVNGSSPDDVASVADSEDGNESQDTESTSSQADPQELPRFVGLENIIGHGNGADSTATAKADEQRSTSSIEFEEPQVCFGAEQVAVINTIRNFIQPQAYEILRYMQIDSSPAQLTATIRQTMTKNSLVLDEPFRVLYVGNAWARDDIMTKIGSALAISANDRSMPSGSPGRSTKFSVVPVSSFGNSVSPEVELIDSLGPELVVDDCTAAKTTKVDGKPDTLVLTLNNHLTCQSRHKGSGFQLQSAVPWKLPDVAIFFRSDSDDLAARQTRHFARSFLSRHAVPSIVISETPIYAGKDENFALNHNSVHMCLESRGSRSTDNRVLRRLPVDLLTFLNIDAAQMNRNLACVTGLHPGGKDSRTLQRDCHNSALKHTSPPHDIEKIPYSLGTLDRGNPSKRKRGEGYTPVLIGLLMGSLFIASIISVTYFNLGPPYWKAQHTPVLVVTDVVTRPSGSVPSKSLKPTLASKVTLAQSISTNPAIPKSLSISKPKAELTTLFSDPSIRSLNKSDRFDMHIIGDSHMILRPPQRFVSLRKAPQLFVKVTRKSRSVNVQLSKLFDGVYALKLEREDAYGPLNVSVWTKSKPLIEQTFEMDFGTPWLKIAGWKKAARNLSIHIQSELQAAQTGFQATLSQMSTDLQIVFDQAAKGAQTIRNGALKFENTSFQRTFQTKALVTARITDLSTGISRQSANIRGQLSQRARAVSKDLTVRVTELTTTISRQVSKIHQSTTGVDVSRFLNTIPRAKDNKSVKKAQRQALTVWRKFPFVTKKPRDFKIYRATSAKHTSRKACKKCNR
ncbi:MAG: hypothetical protein M1812_004121 [Candelaria pacifica]|nr:MAG: hypothetical protein M1812_004121 [Candelaria pacifica]